MENQVGWASIFCLSRDDDDLKNESQLPLLVLQKQQPMFAFQIKVDPTSVEYQDAMVYFTKV
jgi:hypothetical protein